MSGPTFITLGPPGSCHENALHHYLPFQGLALDDVEIVLVDDLYEAVVRVREQPNTFLMQCSAHLNVHLVTERFIHEVFVVDTFIYPTKVLALLVRTDVEDPRRLGMVPAARGYTDLTRWDEVIEETTKPVVGAGLLAGKYDAGLTHLHYHDDHPGVFRVEESYGAIDTTWIVYGARQRFRGEVVGQRVPWLYADAEAQASMH